MSSAGSNAPEEKMMEAEPAEDEDILAGADENATVTPAEEIPAGAEVENFNDQPPQVDSHLLPIVGFGGSEGSIRPLQHFFSVMPTDSGLAFVVVLHLLPDYESQLSEVIQAHTGMPVIVVGEPVKLQANQVYVIPPGQQLVIQDGTIHLEKLENPFGRRVAVDLFFRSLAASHRSRAVAVVLSGMDSDGAIGIKWVKEHGGVTIAQDPDEAEHDGMPRAAINTGMVDWVLPVGQMAQRLRDFAQNEQRISVSLPPARRAEDGISGDTNVDEAAFREILAFLQARTGHDFAHYKRATVLRRITRRLQVNSLSNLPDYLAFLRTHGGEAGALLQDLLISVTNFFRDPEAFMALEAHIPQLFRGKKAGDAVRVWCAGCATGEEAYSLAMLLKEFADTLPSPPAIQIFATDIDDEATRTARDGRYPQAIAADISPERLRRFFTLDQGLYRVRSELREMVLFASHNILRDSPFSRLDLITCRNLLIYFQAEAQEQVFRTFHFALHPEGLLFLGGSEVVNETTGLFVALDKKHRIYGRRPSAGQVPPRRSPVAFQLPDTHSRLASVPLAEQGFSPRPRERAVPGFGELHLQLLEQYSPPSILINADYEILHLSGGAEKFLRFVGGVVSTNFIEVVHPALRLELRTALFRSVQSGESVDVPDVPLEFEGEARAVNLRVCPLRDPERAGSLGHYLLVIFDNRASNALSETILQRTEVDAVSSRLERELSHIKDHLRATVEQYEASSEELKASNEELQAMNEELMTFNRELKSKVEEVARTNSDLQNLMSSTEIATVFLDRQLRVQRFTPAAVELFNFIPTDLGRSLFDLRHRLRYDEMRGDAERVIDRLVPLEREIESEDGSWFLVRVLPYRTVEDRIDGVVFNFLDITERKRAEEALHRSEEHLAAIFMEAAVGLSEIGLDGRFLRVNHELCRILDRPREELLQLSVPDVTHPDDIAPSFETLSRVATERQPASLDKRYQRPDGTLVWSNSSVTPLKNEHGQLRGFLVVTVDLTDRRHAEEALRESEERLQKAIAIETVGVLFFQLDGHILNVNDAAVQMFGYKREELLGLMDWKVLTDLEFLGITAATAENLATRGETAPYEKRMVRKDGSQWWGLFAPTRLSDDGRESECVEFIVDITEAKRAEAALRESEERLRFLVEGTQDYAMFLMDPQRRIFHWNAGAEALFGWSRDEVLGRLGDMIFTPEDRKKGAPQKEAEQAAREGRAPDIRWHLHKDGGRFWSDGIITSLHNDEGELLGFTKILRDATREKAADEELQRAHSELEQRVQERTAALRQEITQRQQLEQERKRLLQSLVAAQEEERRRISRELHDRMSQYLTALILGIKALPPLPGAQERIDTLQKVAATLIEEAHSLARDLRPTALDNLGLPATLRQYVSDWSRSNGIEADFVLQGLSESERFSPEVETALYRVVLEALTNVLRHAGASEVSVVLARTPRHNQEPPFIVAIIEDNGNGFDVESQIDPTSGRLGKSERLGLLGMQERMELVGGKLRIESEPGAPTTVYAYAPLLI